MYASFVVGFFFSLPLDGAAISSSFSLFRLPWHEIPVNIHTISLANLQHIHIHSTPVSQKTMKTAASRPRFQLRYGPGMAQFSAFHLSRALHVDFPHAVSETGTPTRQDSCEPISHPTSLKQYTPDTYDALYACVCVHATSIIIKFSREIFTQSIFAHSRSP